MKERIKLTEKELKQIIKESIKDVFENLILEDENNKKGLIEFLNSLSKEELQELCINYDSIMEAVTYDNPLTFVLFNRHKVYEGLIRTYPIDKVISYISDYFKLHPRQIIKKKPSYNGCERILIYIPTIDDNVDIMIQAMESCGYFLAHPKYDKIEPNKWETLQFEAKIQPDDSKQIREEEKTLLHLTPLKNLRKIQHIGLSPRSNNEMLNFPERIYFLRGSTDRNEIIKIGQKLCDNNNSQCNFGKYALITLDLNKISNKIKFCLDPNYAYGIFTTSNISPESIIDVEEIDFNM